MSTRLCRVWPVLAALGLAACVSVDLTRPEDGAAVLPDRAAAVRVGETADAGVRAVLGEPLLASAGWRFDLFRDATVQTSVPVVLTPLPVPFGRETDALFRYTLVAYDADGRAAAVASGVFRKPSAFRRTAPIRSDYPALHLRAGELMFFVDPEGGRREHLLLAPAGRDAQWQRSPGGEACAVVVGCGEHGCPDRLAVDGGVERRLPLRLPVFGWLREDARAHWLRGVGASTAWLEALVVLELSPGAHTLRFSSRVLGGEHTARLACEAGERTFLTVTAVAEGKAPAAKRVEWQLERAQRMPASFAGRPLVLVHDGVPWVTGIDAAAPAAP